MVAINTVSSQLESAGYGDRVLAAVFAFEENGKPLYFIYNFKRGAYYPFVPAPGEQARDTERELRLQSQLGAELPWEADMARWFPLWDIPPRRRSARPAARRDRPPEDHRIARGDIDEIEVDSSPSDLSSQVGKHAANPPPQPRPPRVRA